MKIILAALLFTSIVSCTSKTEYGDCVGLFDDKLPNKTYKVSGWNTFLGVIGTSLFFIPTIFVVKDETFCPVGNK